MKYAVRYRLSDGGVVSAWSGPDKLPSRGKRPLSALQRAWKAVGGTPNPAPVMVDPIPLLAGPTQGALEIDAATYEGLGKITEKGGRLRWVVVGGKLQPADGLEIYSSGRPIVDAPKTNSAALRLGRQ